MRTRKQPPEPATLTEINVAAFMSAAQARPPKTVAEIREHIKYKNPVRWARLQRDLKWLRKLMKRYGLSEEDARWLL